MRQQLTGFAVSSSELYSGSLELEVRLDASDAEALVLVESRLQQFVKAIDAGYFFPGRRRGSDDAVAAAPGLVSGRLEVDQLPTTAIDVLSGLLLDFVYNEMFSIRSARAITRSGEKDLLVETSRRPAAFARPPFTVELPQDADLGNNTLLVEIQFAGVVPQDIGEKLLEELAIMEVLWLAYPIEDENGDVEPVESLGAQRHFNDPRTIHHHEWAWDADPTSWNLLVNLCCAWHRTAPIVRLHVE
jgi:hypothetical protein